MESGLVDGVGFFGFLDFLDFRRVDFGVGGVVGVGHRCDVLLDGEVALLGVGCELHRRVAGDGVGHQVTDSEDFFDRLVDAVDVFAEVADERIELLHEAATECGGRHALRIAEACASDFSVARGEFPVGGTEDGHG